MTREDQTRRDAIDRLEAALTESRRLGHEAGELADLPRCRDRMLLTIAEQELRIRELLGKLDTATSLRLLHADEPYARPKADRRNRS
jgi:hypothetical protein